MALLARRRITAGVKGSFSFINSNIGPGEPDPYKLTKNGGAFSLSFFMKLFMPPVVSGERNLGKTGRFP